jgi:hypothetical protein
VPGKHTSGPVGLARLLPSGVRLRTVLDRARTASAARRNRVIAAAAVALLVAVGGVGLLAGGPKDWPLFVAPVIPIGDGAAIGIDDPSAGPSAGSPGTEPPVSAPAVLPVSDEQPSTPGADPGPTPAGPQPVIAPGRSKPVASRPSASPAAGLTADYLVSASWETGFIVGVLLTNPTDRPVTWRVVVTHDRRAGVRVTNAWNAALERDGSTAILTGGPLAPGATHTFGFEATKQFPGPVRPASCTVNGTPCTVR